MAGHAGHFESARRPGRRGGFTAFEVLLATSILAIISLSVSSALMAGRAQSGNAQSTVYASLLAQELMEEVVRLPYNDPDGTTTLGPSSNETTRQLFDNSGDYLGYTDGTGTTLPTITDLAGTVYPTVYQGFTRSVSVAVTSYSPSGWGRTMQGLLVTVRVSKGGRTYATLEQFVTP